MEQLRDNVFVFVYFQAKLCVILPQHVCAAVKHVFATVKWYIYACKSIKHKRVITIQIYSFKTHFQNIFLTSSTDQLIVKRRLSGSDTFLIVAHSSIWVEFGCLTSQLTIFQSYMWRHIDVQADWRSAGVIWMLPLYCSNLSDMVGLRLHTCK